MYSQKNKAWADKELGSSGLKMANYGCVVTDVAIALKLAGYNVDPGQVVDNLNRNGGFTDSGLIIWAKVEEAYPQFHFGGDGYLFQKGLLGKYIHWLLVHNNKVYNPISGGEGVPAGYIVIAGSRTASIEPAEKQKEQVNQGEQLAPETKIYVVQKGDTLWRIAGRVFGDSSRWPEIYKINKDRIANPDLIYPGQEIRIP